MCGLFGVVSKAPLLAGDLERARKARDVLLHRGPDQYGEWSDSHSFHGHRRLSIIDLSESGRQPMQAGNVIITVNGEIYNFAKLREELIRNGHQFRSGSDSEVVLHGYRAWGIEGLVERIDGMYAATVYDADRKRIFAIRDRAGIKPFHYYFDQDTFVWASEIKALRHYVGKARLDIDPEAAVDFLTYKFIPAPKTFYRKVHKLPRAHVLELNIAEWKLQTRRYWDLPQHVRQTDDASLKAELAALLSESVKEQLLSDVPLGLFLSGGIDSSTVAVFAAKHKKRLDCFSLGFPGPLDESGYACNVANHLGFRHHVEMFETRSFENYFDEMLQLFDEPFGDSSSLPTQQVCAFARRAVTVCLSGDGGDECFGGYKRYRQYVKLGKRSGLSRTFSYLRQGDLGLAFKYDPLRSYAKLRGAISPAKLRKWKQVLGVPGNYDELWHYRAHYVSSRSPLMNARVLDFNGYLPEGILTKVDRTSMRHSLECRPPFLSRKLLEFSFSLPESFIFAGGELKHGLKQSIRDELPEEVFSRPKKGFGIPIRGWKKTLSFPGRTLEETFLQKILTGDVVA